MVPVRSLLKQWRNAGITYFVSIASDTQCWLKMPVLIEKNTNIKGKTEKKPIEARDLAKKINNYFWYKRKVSEGTKGPIEYEFTKRQVVLAKNGLPDKVVWLVIKRTVGPALEYSYYFSNAPASSRLSLFVWLSGLRWAIEQCFEETKGELGLDHYEVRKYRGWNHHILTCMMAHFFLWHIKIRLGKKAPSITLSQLRVLLKVVMPLRRHDISSAIELIRWIQYKNHRAYLLHRKKRLLNAKYFL